MAVTKAFVDARPAGGEWCRPSLGWTVPPLIPVAGRPVLLHVLDRLAADGITSVVLAASAASASHLREAVGGEQARGLDVRFMEAAQDGGLVGPLLAAEELLEGGPLLVQHVDALLWEPIIGLGRRLTEERLDALVLRMPPGGEGRPRGERPVLPIASVVACLMGSRALTAARAAGIKPEAGIQQLLAVLREHGGRVGQEEVDACLPVREGSAALLRANRRMLDRLRPVLPRVNGGELAGAVSIHPSAVLERAVVHGPVFIGPRTRICDAYVGPYTSLGADVAIEGVEIQDSIVLDDARLRFIGTRLEDSVIGRGARIERDQRMPRAIRLVVADCGEVRFP
jgi:glucose-1-phosphate thymidylyltransferase